MTSDANGSFLMKWIRKIGSFRTVDNLRNLFLTRTPEVLNSLPGLREMLSGNNLTER